MARLLVFILCASMVTTQRNGNVVKDKGELNLKSLCSFIKASANVRFAFWPCLAENVKACWCGVARKSCVLAIKIQETLNFNELEIPPAWRNLFISHSYSGKRLGLSKPAVKQWSHFESLLIIAFCHKNKSSTICRGHQNSFGLFFKTIEISHKLNRSVRNLC